MAGKKIKGRVAGYNLLETVIAMVVIVVVSGIAMAIFTRITEASLSGKKVRAAAIVQAALLKAERKKPLLDSSYTAGDLIILETVSTWPDRVGLSILQISALDTRQDTVITIRKVVTDE